MKTKNVRTLVALAVIVVVALGFALSGGIGTLSAFGLKDISLLCPVGALGSMIASHTVIPRAVASLAIAVVLVLVFARAFCGWVCPVPLVSKIRDAVSKKKGGKAPAKEGAQAPLDEKEKSLLHGCSGSCKNCGVERAHFDSRHITLVGALLSAAIFGFPVFCLICPVGLTFATIFLVILLFGGGDVTWSVLVAPIVLLIEVVFFRKWCAKFCPISAFMSLIGKGNRTFRPTIDDSKCLETSKGAHCGQCAEACPVGIDPRHPERGALWSECMKCRACVDACPGKAIKMPFLPKKCGDGTTKVTLASDAKDGE